MDNLKKINELEYLFIKRLTKTETGEALKRGKISVEKIIHRKGYGDGERARLKEDRFPNM